MSVQLIDKRFFSILLSLFLFVAPQLGMCQQVDKVSNNTVKIGVTIPLTGNLSYIGEDIRRGITLALEDRKDSGPRFEVIFDDNGDELRRAANSAQKLIEQDHVNVIVSLWNCSDIVAPTAERRQVPHIAIRWNPHVTEKNRFTFTLESTYISFVRSQTELLKALNISRAALITSETQGELLQEKAQLEQFSRAGIEITSHILYPAELSDFLSIVSKTLATNPDVIVLNNFSPGTEAIIKRIREQRPKQKITGYFESVDPPAAVENLPFVAQFEVAPWFTEGFKARFGEPFKVRAPHGYDVIKILAEIYDTQGTVPSGKEVVAKLSQLKDFPGATGTLSVNATRNIESQCVWKIAHDNQFIPLTQELISHYKVGVKENS